MEQALPSFEFTMNPRDFSAGVDVSQLTAEEYMAWVRYESEHIPGVVRVDAAVQKTNQTKYMPEVEDIAHCPDSFLPDILWENSTIESFSNLRLVVERRAQDVRTRERKLLVPAMKDQSSWYTFCLGGGHVLDSDEESAEDSSDQGAIVSASTQGTTITTPVPAVAGSDLEDRKAALLHEFAVHSEAAPPPGWDSELNNDENEDEGGEGGEMQESSTPAEPYPRDVPPTMGLMLQFDQVLTQRLLGYHTMWLGQRAIKERDRLLGTGGTGLQEVSVEEVHVQGRWKGLAKQCRWIYSLLCRLEKPLHRDVAADVRSIYRSCCLERRMLALHFSSYYSAKAKGGTRSGSEEQRSGVPKEVRFEGAMEWPSVPCAGGGLAIEDAECPYHVTAAAQEHLAVLNMIILVTGKYFGQGETFSQESSDELCNSEDTGGGDSDMRYNDSDMGKCYDAEYRLDDDGRGDY